MTKKKSFTTLSLEEYLNQLSSDEPVPGGGSVSAYVSTLGMGLTQMVGGIAVKRPIRKDLKPEELQKEKDRLATIRKIVTSLEKTKRDAFQIVNLDPEVYQEVMNQWKNPEKREDALENSFRLQAELAFLIVMANEWNRNMADLVSGSIKNDLLVSAAMLEGAFRGAYHTAMINARYMGNKERRERSEKALQEVKARFEKGDYASQTA